MAWGLVPTWRVGDLVILELATTGRFPVRNVTFDVIGDGLPAWEFLLADGRGTWRYHVGPVRRSGRYPLSLLVRDDQGCEATRQIQVEVIP